MIHTLESFVLQVDNLFSDQECQWYIDFFNYLESSGLTSKRNYTHKHIVNDTSIAFQELKDVYYNLNSSFEYSNKFTERFWEHVYKPYADHFSILNEAQNHHISALKIQKSYIGDAYHRWHFETDTSQSNSKLLTFLLYLNDVEEGGETEFLYFPKRVKATTGKIILFPGNYTHTHRGNPPLSNEKYVITGWVHFV